MSDIKPLTIELLNMRIRDDDGMEWRAHHNRASYIFRCESCGQVSHHIYLRVGVKGQSYEESYTGRCPNCVSLHHRWGRLA